MSENLEQRLSMLQPAAPQVDWKAIWYEQGRIAGRAEALAAVSPPATSARCDTLDRSSPEPAVTVSTTQSSNRTSLHLALWPTLTALSTSAALFLAVMLARQSSSDSSRLAVNHGDSPAIESVDSEQIEPTANGLKSLTNPALNHSSSAQSTPAAPGTAPLAPQLALSQAISKPSWWDQLIKLPTPSLEWRMRFGPGVTGAREAWEYRNPVNVSIPVVAPVEDSTHFDPNFDSHDSYQDSLRSPRTIPNILGGWL